MAPIRATHLLLLLLFFFASTPIATSSSQPPEDGHNNVTAGDIDWWCDTTPHPQPCKYFVRHARNNQYDTSMQRSGFRRIAIDVAMQRALTAYKQILHLRSDLVDHRQRTVWVDCLKLYDNTLLQLNRTLQCLPGLNRTCTDFDVQTWLSTALTNIETCRLGSQDLNVSDSLMIPTSSTNLSQLLSNGLAANGGLLGSEQPETEYEEFPSWVTDHERKLLQSTSLAARANLVVAKDGSGNFRTVQAAINAVAKRRSMSSRFVIYVKKGVYRENIEVGINNNNIMLVGDSMRNTIITSSRSVGGGFTTYSSATAGIDGLRFIARDITFSNTAGPLRGQAVALRSASDLAVFYRCAIQGYQDTLFVHSQRQFYRDCYIYGTVDFIFGNAAVVFQNCMIYARRPLKGQANVITAQGRNDPYQNTGIVIQNSRVLAARDLLPVVRAFKTYLGRPWQQYSRTVYLKTYLGSLVSPVGWSSWGDSNFAQSTVYYGEYQNSGPASSTRYRVRWPGYHVITSANEASQFTVSRLIAGQSWLPATGLPFAPGL
ncbi:Endoglucanase [Psidium guajava]|nr:Endoglucanase [Psidium guajava]